MPGDHATSTAPRPARDRPRPGPVADRTRRWAAAAGLALAGVVLAACGAGGATAATSSVGASGSTSGTTRPATTTTTRPLLPQPTAAHPLTVLSVGDSLGEDLGLGLADVLGDNPLAHVVQDAVGDTGLDRPDFYDWPVHLAADLAATHPAVVVVLLGANDSQGETTPSDATAATFGTPQWTAIYNQRVATMMHEVLATGAKLIWVGLPIMGPNAAVTNANMAMLNSIYAAQARAHPGVIYFPTWALFSDAEGDYTQDITNAEGEQVEARDPDEVHLAPGGYDYLATAVTAELAKAFDISLSPPPGSSTTTTS